MMNVCVCVCVHDKLKTIADIWTLRTLLGSNIDWRKISDDFQCQGQAVFWKV